MDQCYHGYDTLALQAVNPAPEVPDVDRTPLDSLVGRLEDVDGTVLLVGEVRGRIDAGPVGADKRQLDDGDGVRCRGRERRRWAVV